MKRGRLIIPKPLRIPVAQKSGSLDSDLSTPQDSPLDLSLKSSSISPKTISDRFVSIITESLTSSTTSSSGGSIPLSPFNLTAEVTSESLSPKTPHAQHLHSGPPTHHHLPVFDIPASSNRTLIADHIKSEPDCSPPLLANHHLPKSPTTLTYSPQHAIDALKFAPSSLPPQLIVQTLNSVNSQRPDYTCPICSQVFSLHDRLAKHMASLHRSRHEVSAKTYVCEVYKRSFARSDMLTRHMRLHTGLKPYTCRVPIFDIPTTANRAMIADIKSEPDCSPPLTPTHLSKSPIITYSPQHPINTLKFTSAQIPHPELIVQTVSGVNSQRADYTCPICSQVFSLHDRLAKHMASRHRSRQHEASAKTYVCEVCKRSFARSDMLTRHMRLHTGIKPYTCRVCGQVFSRSDHLSTHQRTHTGEKPYKCPQCPYAACRRDMITRHMRTHARYELPDSSSSLKEANDAKLSGGGGNATDEVPKCGNPSSSPLEN